MKTMSLVGLLLALCLTGCASKPTPGGPGYGGGDVACKSASKEEIRGLFDRWNRTLLTRVAHNVVGNYARDSILLPTLSNIPRISATDKEKYFDSFLANWPSGKINDDEPSLIDIGCNYAVDAGIYTFTFARNGAIVQARYSFSYRWNGTDWLITSHHSSKMPEANTQEK